MCLALRRSSLTMRSDDREKAHLVCLLADFTSLKAEIARRSNLQRVALAAYIAVYAWLFPQLTSNRVTSISITGLWIAGTMALLFYAREGLEIRRLGGLIRERVAPQAARIVSASPQALIPSEVQADVANPEKPDLDETRERKTRWYYLIFMWSVFLVTPALTTALFISRRWGQLTYLCGFDTPTPYLALVVLLALVQTVLLLLRHCPPEEQGGRSCDAPS